MNTLASAAPLQKKISLLLRELSIPVHRLGFKFLRVAILVYLQNEIQTFSKELYPAVMEYFHLSNWHVVENAIREAIADGWEHGNRTVWLKYFPGIAKAPSNAVFIATIAEHVK